MGSMHWAVITFLLIGLGLFSGGGQTAEGADADFSFVVFGDSQFATNSSTSGIPERLAVPEVVLALEPTFALHTGDLMDHGRDPEAYDRFVTYYAGMLARIPFFPTMGNHDAGYAGIANYRTYLKKQLWEINAEAFGTTYQERFSLFHEDDKTDYPQRFDDPRCRAFRDRVPSGASFKTFYAFRFANAYFISCEQGTRWWANTPTPWLERHLKKAHEDPGIDHIVVFLHHPLYSTTMRENPPDPAKPGSGECIAPVRRQFEPLFRQYDVTLAFSGHAHLYDHCYVPDDDHETRADPPPKRYPHDGRAVHYIVAGGGGGPLNRGGWAKERSYRFFQKRICAYNVVQVEVVGKALTVTVHTVKGSAEKHTSAVFDRFVLEP